MRTRMIRFFTLIAAALLMLATVTACGDENSDAGPSGPSREYTDARGATVEIPQQPGKIVTLAEGALDASLALGVIPVGTTSARGQTTAPAYLGAQAAGIPIVATPRGPNLQQILKARPDLILVDDTTAARNSLDELTKIAPTLLIAKYADGWEKYFKAVADVLNKPEQYRTVTGEITTEIATVKQQVTAKQVAGRAPTASIVRWAADGPTIVGGNSMSSWVLTQVGFTRPAAQEKINSQGRSGDKVSLENLDLIDADYLFFGVLAGKEKAAEELSAARKLPGFGTLGANRSGNVLPVDGVPWTSGSGPLGVKSVLAEISAAAR